MRLCRSENPLFPLESHYSTHCCLRNLYFLRQHQQQLKLPTVLPVREHVFIRLIETKVQ